LEKLVRRSLGGGKSGNPAAFAGFPSEVGSPAFGLSTQRLFPRPSYPRILL